MFSEFDNSFKMNFKLFYHILELKNEVCYRNEVCDHLCENFPLLEFLLNSYF